MKSKIYCLLLLGIGFSFGCKSPLVIPAGMYRDRTSNSYAQVWDERLRLHVEIPGHTNDVQFRYGLLSDGRILPATRDYWYGREPFELFLVNSGIVVTNPSTRTGISLNKTQ
jgi:hypothetical protein